MVCLVCYDISSITTIEDTQGMPQLRDTALPRHQKRRDEKYIRTNQTSHMIPRTLKQRTVTEEPLWNVERDVAYKIHPCIKLQSVRAKGIGHSL